MAVRFACPSCRQPIEVDDNWAGQSVACPYCRKVVTAPHESNWPPQDIPVASPVRPNFAPPPPPAGYPNPQGAAFEYAPQLPSVQQTHSAGWAMLLAAAGAVLSLVAYLIYSYAVFSVAVQQVGMNAPREQLLARIQQIIDTQAAPASPAAASVLVVGVCCGLAAIGLAIRAFVRRERSTGLAIAAFIIATLFVCCQLMLGATMLLSHQPAGG